jgi:RNA recognition motif-containing protein
LFGQYGEVTSCVVKKSFNSEYSYAFIDFKEGDDATLAMEKLIKI